eukprot:CAMPEP_0116923996 /NCGR_PEP_ID=MMETSP0467-20121206/23230_1 /TAXON_ID=283647 /ORGANISM="Mesodinium pulex, Strain SPMC105" /LENGTH=105 /DNA_ID=CAMNT_0004602705 /DNA_START=422 /DNA_END=739 /DNA_ORIENTATION=+
MERSYRLAEANENAGNSRWKEVIDYLNKNIKSKTVAKLNTNLTELNENKKLNPKLLQKYKNTEIEIEKGSLNTLKEDASHYKSNIKVHQSDSYRKLMRCLSSDEI